MNLNFINQKNEETVKADWKIAYIKFMKMSSVLLLLGLN